MTEFAEAPITRTLKVFFVHLTGGEIYELTTTKGILDEADTVVWHFLHPLYAHNGVRLLPIPHC